MHAQLPQSPRASRQPARVLGPIALALSLALWLGALSGAAEASGGIGLGLPAAPNLLGKPLAQAQFLLGAKGIPYKLAYSNQSSAQPNHVLAQTPKPGHVILPFMKMTIWIKAPGGPSPAPAEVLVAVPDVLAKKLSDAKAALGLLGLKTNPVGPGKTKAAGRVASQSPSAGAVVPQGSTVTLQFPSTKKTISVSLPKGLVLRPERYRGDSEFNGNGPHMVLKAEIFHDAKRVRMRLALTAREVGGDGSAGRIDRTITLYTAPANRKITSVSGATGGWIHLVNDVDTSHRTKQIVNAWGTFVLFGDHRGKDLGSYTRIEAAFKKALSVVTE